MSKAFFLLLLTAMLVCMFMPLSPYLLKVDATSDFPVHNTHTGLNYATIQSAINAKQTVDGSQILVDAGTYNETLSVSKGVFLIGSGPSITTINGMVTLSSSGAEIAYFTLNGGVKIIASYCTVSNNVIINTDSYGEGVWSTSADNGFIQYNEIKGFSGSGVYIRYGNGWTILGNDIDNNGGGINLDHSFSCIITENSIHSDWVVYPPAFCLQESSYNHIYHNNCFDNPKSLYNEKQASIETDGPEYLNYWDNGREGNYWDDYNGTDRGDGIGNIPYVIGGENQDDFPLMHTYNIIPEFPSSLVLSLFMIAILLAVIIYRRRHAKISQVPWKFLTVVRVSMHRTLFQKTLKPRKSILAAYSEGKEVIV